MIKQIKSFFKHVTLLDPQYSLNVTIVLLLSVVSFYTSFDGLRHYMFGNDTDNAPWTLLLLLAFLVFLIQLLLIVALMRLTQRISLSNKVSMLLLYIIAMGFSVFLSYSYWYQAIQADNYAYNNFNVQLDDSLSNVGVYQDTFASIKKIATELAEYSQETALLEKNRGRTCGDNSSPGAGPRLSLRNSEDGLFTLMNSNISLLNDEVAQKINKLDSIRYGYSPDANIQELQKAMNVVIAEVNRYKQNPDLVKAKRQLKAHSGENRETLTTAHKDGTRTVSCPDAIITQKAQLLLERINDLPVLKNIRLFNSQDQREVMERALKVFLVIPSTIKQMIVPSLDDAVGNDSGKSAEAVQSADFTPLILGVLIDLIIFFVGYGNGKYSQQRNYLSGKYHGQHFSVTDAIKINHVFNIRSLRENLQWYHHQLGRKHLIIIPSDTYRQSGNMDKRNLVSLMESLLANRRVSLQALRVPFDTLPKNMRRRFSNLPKDTLFEFYHTTEEQWFDLLQSLEADEILTSKEIDTQDFVLSTLEHHQVKKQQTNSDNSTLSLRDSVVKEDVFDEPAFNEKVPTTRSSPEKKPTTIISEDKNTLEKKSTEKKLIKDEKVKQQEIKKKTTKEDKDKAKAKVKEEASKKDLGKDETKRELPEKKIAKKKANKEKADDDALLNSKDALKSTDFIIETIKNIKVKQSPQEETLKKENPEKKSTLIEDEVAKNSSKKNIDKSKSLKNKNNQAIVTLTPPAKKVVRPLSQQHQRIIRKRGRR